MTRTTSRLGERAATCATVAPTFTPVSVSCRVAHRRGGSASARGVCPAIIRGSVRGHGAALSAARRVAGVENREWGRSDEGGVFHPA